MARPELTLRRLGFVLALGGLVFWGVRRLMDEAPGVAGARSGKVPPRAVYVGSGRAKGDWGDVYVLVQPHDTDPPAFTLTVYSGTTGDRLSQCAFQAERAVPLDLDPRDLSPSGPGLAAYSAADGTAITLRLTSGVWPFATPRAETP